MTQKMDRRFFVFVMVFAAVLFTAVSYAQMEGARILPGRRPAPEQPLSPEKSPAAQMESPRQEIPLAGPLAEIKKEEVLKVETGNPVCDEAYQKYCGHVPFEDIYTAVQCLKDKGKEFPAVCQESFKEQLKMYDEYQGRQTVCRKDLKKMCGIDIERMPLVPQEKVQEVYECVLRNWRKINKDCQDRIREGIPFFTLLEEDIDAVIEKLEKKKVLRSHVRVAGTQKTIKVEEQDGDVVWYKAELKKKKVVEQYKFCPPVAEEGLQPYVHEVQGVCYYKVKASWKDRFVNELKVAGLLSDITYFGIGRRGMMKNYPKIKEIADRYGPHCPPGFEVNIYNDDNDARQDVYCERIDPFYCEEDYVRSPDYKEFFGCQKFAECSDSDEGYVDCGDPRLCAVCPSGGCVDHDKTYPDYQGKPVVFCRINYKDPSVTPACAPYRIRRFYNKKGTLDLEQYSRMNTIIETRHYDEDGHLLYWTEYKNNRYKKEYYGDGTLKKERTGAGVKEYDRQGKLIKEERTLKESLNNIPGQEKPLQVLSPEERIRQEKAIKEW